MPALGIGWSTAEVLVLPGADGDVFDAVVDELDVVEPVLMVLGDDVPEEPLRELELEPEDELVDATLVLELPVIVGVLVVAITVDSVSPRISVDVQWHIHSCLR